jgi:GGDEF domain-containing protein
MTDKPRTANGFGQFAHQLNLELKRAERYRIFVSLLLVDLTKIKGIDVSKIPTADEFVRSIRPQMREIDVVSVVKGNRVGVLLPETSRQGAEVVARRVGELVKTVVGDIIQESTDVAVSIEMASYPDAAGTRSLEDYLMELTQPSEN